ncbi:MAG: ATP-binding cassette domain-containing protein [Candidatus Thermoplasmatota archaeon]|nr:ATP-binding cassette domain-containing protein [Candidatus Thermoplasmatota archaeon]
MEKVLEVKEVTYRSEEFALGPVSFSVDEGQVVSIVGPNGAGKTTLLRIVAGLDEPQGGEIVLRGVPSTRMPPEKRGIGFVFQDLALFPHMTVAQNIGYGLWARRVPAPERNRRVAELAEEFGLSGYLDQKPTRLSGGERQRVAIARALASRPSLLLLDEPLHSVDPEHRRVFLADLKRKLREHSTTVLHVTHDLDEGAFLSDSMAVLMEGNVAQWGETQEILTHPVSCEVARFLGYNVWKEAGEWLAALPTSLTLDPEATGPSRAGTVTAIGPTLRGVRVEVLLAGQTASIRIEQERNEPGTQGLASGNSVSVRARQLHHLPAPKEEESFSEWA